MPSFLFWNAQGEFFHDLAPWNRTFSQPHVSRGLAVADYNNDGAMDIAIVDHGEGVRLLRNDIAQGNWVELRLHDRVPPANAPLGFGDGATVIAWVKGVPLRRTVGSSSYLSQDSHRIHIGLGSASSIDRLEVRWLRGPAETWTHVAANQIWDITQGQPELKPFAPGLTASAIAGAPAAADTKSATVQFWAKQHAAMDAMKRRAGLCQGRGAVPRGAGDESESRRLTLLPGQLLRSSRRHFCPRSRNSMHWPASILKTTAPFNARESCWPRLRPREANSHSARQALASALRLNSEETGTLVLLGEVELARGDFASAQTTFAHVCQANPRAANAWYFRGYIAWKNGDLRTSDSDAQVCTHCPRVRLEAGRFCAGRRCTSEDVQRGRISGSFCAAVGWHVNPSGSVCPTRFIPSQHPVSNVDRVRQ